MFSLKKVIASFPTARLESSSDALPVEVSLITQMGHGAGDRLFADVTARQRAHPEFVDALDEPSTKLGGTDFAKGDSSSLYSFAVGANGHPFHRHAGQRTFTAISGSGGAQLRFSGATAQRLEEDPHHFIRELRYIDIPPDCLFTVRFGGETWHQFAPLTQNRRHPAFVALSCHTNELGGNLSEETRNVVLSNQATIPALTTLLPPEVTALLQAEGFRSKHIPVISLTLDAPAGSLQHAMCAIARGAIGALRGSWASWNKVSGFLSSNGNGFKVVALKHLPENSLLASQLANRKIHHEDSFVLKLDENQLRIAGALRATSLLAQVLDGFLQNPPPNVGRLMNLRNFLVRPAGLRTSPLGCPVSSLLSPQKDKLFLGRFPVLDQSVDSDDKSAQVILGADDKHLQFRSCVSVKVLNGEGVEITMGTRVHCKNLFGRIYMHLIDHTHRHYVSPTMLRMAAEHAFCENAPSAEMSFI